MEKITILLKSVLHYHEEHGIQQIVPLMYLIQKNAMEEKIPGIDLSYKIEKGHVDIDK